MEIQITGTNNTRADVNGQNELLVNTMSSAKLKRIENALDSGIALTYYGSTSNIHTITYTGTTSKGVETVVTTITYVDSNVEGSNMLTVQNS
jgi:transcriptional/translational regulatory protein YebC/TACO1